MLNYKQIWHGIKPIRWLNKFNLTLVTLLYIYPYTHDIERASRENFERETLEKNKIDSSTIFT